MHWNSGWFISCWFMRKHGGCVEVKYLNNSMSLRCAWGSKWGHFSKSLKMFWLPSEILPNSELQKFRNSKELQSTREKSRENYVIDKKGTIVCQKYAFETIYSWSGLDNSLFKSKILKFHPKKFHEIPKFLMKTQPLVEKSQYGQVQVVFTIQAPIKFTIKRFFEIENFCRDEIFSTISYIIILHQGGLIT